MTPLFFSLMRKEQIKNQDIYKIISPSDYINLHHLIYHTSTTSTNYTICTIYISPTIIKPLHITTNQPTKHLFLISSIVNLIQYSPYFQSFSKPTNLFIIHHLYYITLPSSCQHIAYIINKILTITITIYLTSIIYHPLFQNPPSQNDYTTKSVSSFENRQVR